MPIISDKTKKIISAAGYVYQPFLKPFLRCLVLMLVVSCLVPVIAYVTAGVFSRDPDLMVMYIYNWATAILLWYYNTQDAIPESFRRANEVKQKLQETE